MPLALSAQAQGGEYLRLVWRAEFTPLSSVNTIRAEIQEALDRGMTGAGGFLVVASPVAVESPQDTIGGFGFAFAEAGVKLAQVAAGKPYADVLAPVSCFSGLLRCNIRLERVERAANLYDKAGLAVEEQKAEGSPLKALTPLIVLAALVAIILLAPAVNRAAGLLPKGK